MTTELAQAVAGRELDALIHECIFGHEVKRHGDPDQWVTLAEPDNPAAGWWFVPCYSTDLLAAWDAAEKVAARNGDTIFSVTRNSLDGERMGGEAKYFCTIEDVSDGIEEWEASADTAPLAICRAALKAVEGK